MPANMYTGDTSDKARHTSNIYIGDANGVARAASKIYIGDADGLARLGWSKDYEIDHVELYLNSCETWSKPSSDHGTKYGTGKLLMKQYAPGSSNGYAILTKTRSGISYDYLTINSSVSQYINFWMYLVLSDGVKIPITDPFFEQNVPITFDCNTSQVSAPLYYAWMNLLSGRGMRLGGTPSRGSPVTYPYGMATSGDLAVPSPNDWKSNQFRIDQTQGWFSVYPVQIGDTKYPVKIVDALPD